MPQTNTYPSWHYQQITPPATTRVIPIQFEIEASYYFLLKKILIQYPTSGNPADFQDPEFKLINNPLSKEFSDDSIPFRLTSTPGRFDPVTTGEIRNQQYLQALTIDWLYLPNTNVELSVSGFQGTGKPSFIDILLIGQAILKSGNLD